MRPILEDTSSRGMAMLIAALFLAVVATAALQFLWLRRLAASHNEVLTGSLQVNASQLAETVTRDLATLVGYFTEQSAGTDCRQQLAAWNARKDIPARVHGIYRVRALNDVHLRGELIAGDGIDQPRAQAIINRIGAAYREGHLPLAQGGTFVPLFDWETASVRVRERAGDDTAWLVLVLNRATFRDPYLTELVRRHFGSAFDVAITRARSGNVVYTAATSDIRKSADLTFDIYDPAISTAVHEASAGLGPQAFQQIRGNGQPAWKLFVRHRAGSIVRAVEQTRMRAAAIATVTLLLLLTSSAALAQSARRSRQFATQRAMFASMVTHELLTPLTVIRSAAETLSERLVSDPDRVSHYGTVIREEGRRLTQTIADVLDLSTGSVALNIERIDLASFVRTRANFLRQAAGNPAGLVIDADTAVVAPADLAALERILRNLLDNAGKYGRHGGQIVLRVGREWDEATISVANEVETQPAGELTRLFEPFVRGAATTATRGKGLGLAIVKTLAEAHGGSAEAESAGNWIIFTVRLPMPGEKK